MLFVYIMTDKYFLNTCFGRQCFLIANQIVHLTTNKPIKNSRCKSQVETRGSCQHRVNETVQF